MTIIDAINDPHLFAPWFRHSSTWATWLIFLKALFGLPMTPQEAMVFQQLTGRTTPPGTQAREAWLVIGRRGGKSFITAVVATYLAAFRHYENYLQLGERAVVMVVASDRRQARVVFRFIRTFFERIPLLAAMVEKVGAESIDLTNRISIEVHSASIRSVRGYCLVACVLDEVAYWHGEDSVNADVEIVQSVRPAMITIPGALLIGISSPYRRSGVLYENYRKHYGRDNDPVLVVQADSRTMNPTIPQHYIDEAYERDPAAALAEYGAEFRSDVAGFLDTAWIDRANDDAGRTERAPVSGVQYVAFCDPSGGGRDSFTLAIAHQDRGLTVLDVCRGRRPPFNPSAVVQEYARLLKEYRCYTVTGDRYAGAWVMEAFRKHGITYKHSEMTKSDLYLEVEPLFARNGVRLLDCRPLLNELQQLERRTRSGGKDLVDHGPGGRDDHANAVAGACVLAAQRPPFAGYQRLVGY